MKGIELFDNYEEDGQLSLFNASFDDWDEDWVENEENSDGEESAESDVEGDAGASAEKKTEDVQSAKSKKAAGKAAGSSVGGGAEIIGGEAVNAGPEIRVKYCASCGKLLFVKEETAGFHSECNNCGIKYFQKL